MKRSLQRGPQRLGSCQSERIEPNCKLSQRSSAERACQREVVHSHSQMRECDRSQQRQQHAYYQLPHECLQQSKQEPYAYCAVCGNPIREGLTGLCQQRIARSVCALLFLES